MSLLCCWTQALSTSLIPAHKCDVQHTEQHSHVVCVFVICAAIKKLYNCEDDLLVSPQYLSNSINLGAKTEDKSCF